LKPQKLCSMALPKLSKGFIIMNVCICAHSFNLSSKILAQKHLLYCL